MSSYIHIVPIRISTESCGSIISPKSMKTSGLNRIHLSVLSKLVLVFTLLQNIDCTVYGFICIASTKICLDPIRKAIQYICIGQIHWNGHFYDKFRQTPLLCVKVAVVSAQVRRFIPGWADGSPGVNVALGKWCKCNQVTYAVWAKNFSTNWPMAIWWLLARSKIYWPEHVKWLIIIHQNSCDGWTIKGIIFTGPSKINSPFPFYWQTPRSFCLWTQRMRDTLRVYFTVLSCTSWAHTPNDLLNYSR